MPAALGALALQAIWTFAFRHPTLPGLEFTAAGWKALLLVCYAPLLLWGPLVAAVTWAYWRRRCRDGTESVPIGEAPERQPRCDDTAGCGRQSSFKSR